MLIVILNFVISLNKMVAFLYMLSTQIVYKKHRKCKCRLHNGFIVCLLFNFSILFLLLFIVVLLRKFCLFWGILVVGLRSQYPDKEIAGIYMLYS